MNLIIDRNPIRKLSPFLAGVVLVIMATVLVRAEVVDATEAGFTVRNTATIAAAPADVYSKLVIDIGRWWDPLFKWRDESPHREQSQRDRSIQRQFP